MSGRRETAGAALDGARRRRSLAIVMATTSVTAVTLGLTWPLLSLILEAQGVSRSLNGLSSASQTVAILAILPLAPWLLDRIGTIRLMYLAIAVMVAMLLLLPVFANVYAWFPIRFALGAATEILLIAGDIWVNQAVDPRSRGKIIGLYGFVLSAGFAAGPLIINLTGIDGWTPFLIGAAVVATAALPLIAARGLVPPIEGRPSGRLVYFVRVAPVLMLAGLMYGLVDSALLSFLPLYGLGNGLDEAASVTLVTVLVAGSVAGQLPFGWLADRVDRRILIIAISAITLAASLALPLVIGDRALLWPLLALWGAAMGGFYLVGMVMMGERYRGADLVAVNAAFVVLWGLGGITGPALTGAAMDLWGPSALPFFIAACCLLFLPVAVARHMRGRGG